MHRQAVAQPHSIDTRGERLIWIDQKRAQGRGQIFANLTVLRRQIGDKVANLGAQARQIEHGSQSIVLTVTAQLDPPGEKKLQEAAMRESIEAVARAGQKRGAAQFHIELIGIQSNPQLWLIAQQGV